MKGIMISKDDEPLEEIIFDYSGTTYIARLYKRADKPSQYGEIVLASNNERISNMKGLAREILKPYGVDIPTDAKTVVTHTAVKKLIEFLENENSTEPRNKQIKNIQIHFS